MDYSVTDVEVLVIGAGASGVRASIALAQQGVNDILVIGKREHGDAHTTWARGGVNAALGSLDSEDSWEVHAADTLKEGHMINDPDKVETVAKEAPNRVLELDEWGMDFTRTEDGKINQRYFGAQSFRRTCFAGDHTGESMLETLIDKAKSLDVPYRQNVMITKIFSDNGKVAGAAGFDMESGERLYFDADRVILAAGGYSAIYSRHTSRDDENNGDGVALAWDAGAELMDMEMVQFHPTGMSVPDEISEWSGRLVTEAVRGEGGRLFNSKGERFMQDYSPKQMELDARDVVARAIQTEIDNGRGTENGGVFLDISHKDREFIKERLPRMYSRFDELGIDLSEEAVEVAPTAHYSMGGVKTDENAQTRVSGLYAVGETMAGVHGANRLGGNSLAETIVYGKVAADHIVESDGPDETVRDKEIIHHFEELLDPLDRRPLNYNVDPLIQRLREAMWEMAGLRKTEEDMDRILREISSIREKISLVDLDNITSEEFEKFVNLKFMVCAAEKTVLAAAARRESRGAHYRVDYPEKEPKMNVNMVFSGNKLVLDGPGNPSEEVQSALDEDYELDYTHLE